MKTIDDGRAALGPLRLPLVAAPMFRLSGADYVVAACRAGIVGALPAHNARSPEDLDALLADITRRLAEARADPAVPVVGPWALNLVTHRTNARLAEDLKRVGMHRPPLVVTALGGPKPVLETVHGYGGLVLADVVSVAQARKAVEAGADGLVCVCAGAGGHTGHLNPFAFAGAVRAFFDGLLVLGGGIADGHGVAGVLAAGADLAYVGTRFIACAESLASPDYRRMLIDSEAADLVVSDAITGAPASWLKPSLRAHDLDPEQLDRDRLRDAGDAPGRKRWRDLWGAGQGVGAIRGVETLGEIVADMERGFLAARDRIVAWPRRDAALA